MPAIRTLSELTPPSRNRAIDLYRAVAIVMVVLGHWIGAAVWVTNDGALRFNNILALDDWTHWLTWIVQVMPVFFIVGGYANWRSRHSERYAAAPFADWLTARARRLMTPVTPFIVTLTLLVLVTLALGVDDGIVRSGSWNAIVPLWFLGVYLMTIAMIPVTSRLWDRFGWWSVVGGMILAFAVDGARAAAGQDWIGWINYLVVWSAVHQIGYGWASETQSPSPRVSGGLVVAGLGAMVLLTVFGPYPVSMVAVPGAPENNTLPPTAMMAVIAAAQYGLLRLLEPAAQRVMARPKPWVAVVGLHTVMMTVYIWHLTALALVVLAGYGTGFGFGHEPLTTSWWLTRPIWLVVLCTVLGILVLLFGRFEHMVRVAPTPHLPVLALGILASVAAIAVSTTMSIVARDGKLTWWVLGLYAVGIASLGAWPSFRRTRQA